MAATEDAPTPPTEAVEEAPAETDAAPSDEPPPVSAEEDPWASFPKPVAADEAPGSNSGDADAPAAPEPSPEGDAWAAFDGAAAAADDASPGVTSGSLGTSSFEHTTYREAVRRCWLRGLVLCVWRTRVRVPARESSRRLTDFPLAVVEVMWLCTSTMLDT